MALNKALLIGNVGKDPDVRYLDNNTKVASFTIATTERYRDRNNELKEMTEWHNIVCWRRNADIVEQYVKKGTQLFIEGRIRTRNWDDQNGNKRYVTEIIADTLQLLGRRADNPASYDSQPAGAPQNSRQPAPQPRMTPEPQQAAAVQASSPAPQVQQAPAAPEISDDDDDLPF